MHLGGIGLINLAHICSILKKNVRTAIWKTVVSKTTPACHCYTLNKILRLLLHLPYSMELNHTMNFSNNNVLFDKETKIQDLVTKTELGLDI